MYMYMYIYIYICICMYMYVYVYIYNLYHGKIHVYILRIIVCDNDHNRKENRLRGGGRDLPASDK